MISKYLAGAVVGTAAFASVFLTATPPLPHGSVISPMSRVYRVYQANPSNPSFPLAANAVAMDGTLSYYTWNEVSRNIPAAVQAGLPAGFDYSPWIPDGELASAGRTDPNSPEYPRTYAGLDQVSADWPTTPVTAGETINVTFHATALHSPSVWDVWMTKPTWNPTMPLTWAQMEFLGRPTPTLTGQNFDWNLTIPANRSGHHVLWVAWQRDDPVGEVFFSTSDLMIAPANDECVDATVVALGPNGAFDLAGASPSTPAASCSNANDPDVWFRYTAQCTGTLRADTCASAGATDTSVSIWSGSCGALVEIGCDDNGCGVHSAATANVTMGNDYWLKVAAPVAGDTSFELAVSYDNNTGSFATTAAGCGAATLFASGAPNLGGIVDYTVQGSTGLVQAIALGFTPTAIPVCAGCSVGTTSDAMVAAQFSLTIPCDPALVGLQWWAQGIDAFATSGGCNLGGGVDFTLTNTVRTQVGN